MGINERKERNKKKMREQILVTAMNLFLEEGFQNVSIRKIADKIEYSPATIYLYYKDKDEILFALHDEGFDKLFKRQQSVHKIADPRKRLRKHGEMYLKFAFENPEYYNLMFITRSPGRKVVEKGDWNSGIRSYELIKNDVAAAIKAGAIKDSDIDVITFALWSFVHGIVSLILRNRCSMLDQKHLPVAALKAYNTMMDNWGLAV